MKYPESRQSSSDDSLFIFHPPSSIFAFRILFVLFVLLVVPSAAWAQVYNIRVVTDANPDYSDLPSLVRSATSRFDSPQQKCWAMFYWNHIARRQTNPINLHGMALTDPIRQFNDYGYTMCSTISGINQSIWEEMGLKHRYWDISNHTVSEVLYDGGWHMYDNSMSAIYTLCDGKTIASVADIGKEGACALSGGKVEAGHIAKYHCLTSTSPRGFLTGADAIRSLDEEYRCFNPNGLKLRTYFYDWERGHRYILNLRPGESYTRSYHATGDKADFFIPNDNGKDPESVNPRYHLRGNGEWRFHPILKDAKELARVVYSMDKLKIRDNPEGGLAIDGNAETGNVIFKINSANVMTGLEMTLNHEGTSGFIRFAVSRDNGLHWNAVHEEPSPPWETKVFADEQVNGAYEVLVRFELTPRVVIKDLKFLTITALNSKTQPRLNIGRNTIYVDAGEQTDSTVLWPELQGENYKEMIVEEKNIKSAKKHPGYMGTVFPATAKQDAYLVYKIETPRDLTSVTYGGRFYNRAPKSHIEMLHSFDAGKTWIKSWSLSDTAQPWDVIHYETVAPPPGCKSILMKYLMNTPDPHADGCSIYSLRMEGRSIPPEPAHRQPIEVTFNWNEVQKDRSLVKKSHTEVVENWPATYTIDVGGEDHPVMESLKVSLAAAGTKQGGAAQNAAADQTAKKWTGVWQTNGKNLAIGKSYTLSVPSDTTWSAGDPDHTKLTDGIAGPPYAGGASYQSGAIWNPKRNPVIVLDLGTPQTCAAFGMNFHGYPWHDALKGQIKDQVKVLVSEDGKTYTDVGPLQTDLRWKDLPLNHMWTDEETMTGGTFRVIPDKPITARYVKYEITSDRNFCCTELEVLDSIKSEPFDLKIALPEKK